MEKEFLVAGLGNPGREYAETRHNMGFMVADALADKYNFSFSSSKFNSEQAKGRAGDTRLTLVKPMSFMNRSGMPLQNVSRFFDITEDRIIVVHDELDLPFGTVRLKQGGGHGGHNGLRSIIEAFGNGNFARLRMGIGRPQHGDVTNFVLGKFNADEQTQLENVLDTALAALECFFEHGLKKAMNEFNQNN